MHRTHLPVDVLGRLAGCTFGTIQQPDLRVIRGGESPLWPLSHIAMPISMFDWPEPIHTSPMRMSSNSILFLPLIAMRCDLPSAFTAGSTTFQLPWASALAVAVASSSFTVTSSPGSAQPQIGSGRSRCSTMWLPITLGSLTSAWAWGSWKTRRAGRRKGCTATYTSSWQTSLVGWIVVRGGMAGRHVCSIVVSARPRVNRQARLVYNVLAAKGDRHRLCNDQRYASVPAFGPSAANEASPLCQENVPHPV